MINEIINDWKQSDPLLNGVVTLFLRFENSAHGAIFVF